MGSFTVNHLECPKLLFSFAHFHSSPLGMPVYLDFCLNYANLLLFYAVQNPNTPILLFLFITVLSALLFWEEHP